MTDDERRHALRRRRVISLVVLGFFVSGFVTIVGLCKAFDWGKIHSGNVGVFLGILIDGRVQRIASSSPGPFERIGFLGDSTVQAFPPGKRINEKLQVLLDQQAPRRFKVFPFTSPGMSVFEYYFLADRISAAGLNQVVVPVNLATFSSSWQEKIVRRETAGWLSPRRLPDLMKRPYYWWNLTLDRLLLYIGFVQLDFSSEWFAVRAVQIRADRSIQAIRGWLQRPRSVGWTGFPRMPLHVETKSGGRPDEYVLRRSMGDVLNGISAAHPVLRLLDGTLAEFQRAGISAVVYTVPANVEHFARFEVGTPTGLMTSINAIRDVVERRGGEFVDLHRILPDAGFRDAQGHFTFDGDFDGPSLVARRLLPYLFRETTTASESTRQRSN